MRKAILLLAAPVLATAVACSFGSTNSHHLTPQAKASVSALASVPGYDAQQILIRAGVPVNGTPVQQLAFGKAMLVKANRQALAQKLKIPAGNRPAFEAAVLGKAESDHLTTHAGRVQFMTVDLPNLVKQYQ